MSERSGEPAANDTVLSLVTSLSYPSTLKPKTILVGLVSLGFAVTELTAALNVPSSRTSTCFVLTNICFVYYLFTIVAAVFIPARAAFDISGVSGMKWPGRNPLAKPSRFIQCLHAATEGGRLGRSARNKWCVDPT